MCHHVTGECLPCAPGLWGDACKEKCRCDKKGTELCGHTDGRCFCKGNRFGLRCELLRPRGCPHRRRPGHHLLQAEDESHEERSCSEVGALCLLLCPPPPPPSRTGPQPASP